MIPSLAEKVMPGLLLLRIHTDAGVVGCGETYYVPHAVTAMIHDWMGRRLLGADPLWAEDMIRPDSIDTIADFRDKAGIPLAVSEMMIGHEDYRLVLEKRAADYIMIDPTWVGGISQTHRIAQMAQLYNLPVVMHDCTGPLTLLSGIHVATATANVAWQETLRAHLRILYPKLINETSVVEDGLAIPPEQPGIGATWLDSHFESGHSVRVSEL